MDRSSVRHRLRKLGLYQQRVASGRIEAPSSTRYKLPRGRKVKRYILTSCQNNTHVHRSLWSNLQALAKHYRADVLVGTFSYDVNSYGKMAVKAGREKTQQVEVWFDPAVRPFIVDDQVQLAPDLIWCGDMNIIPTAIRPLSGFDAYNGRASNLFPHAKMTLESVPGLRDEGTKMNWTTGCVSQRNYIAKKAGMKADREHAYGALLVEVNSSGDWFVNQLESDEQGTIQHFDVRVKKGRVKTGCRVEAITWGDSHAYHQNRDCADCCWFGPKSMLDVLRPKYQFFHDVLDFYARNHHDSGSPYSLFKKWATGADSVETELMEVVAFLQSTSRPWCESVVVAGNHDAFLPRWLEEGNYKTDPANAVFFLKAQLATYEAMHSGNPDFYVVEHMLNQLADEAGLDLPARFLRCDESFVVCGVECGMHGHLGPNGARGNATNLSRMGRKANIGHTHSAQIRGGVWVAGTNTELVLPYTKGPSSWSHTDIVTYPHGGRSMVTKWKGKWRA